MEPMLQEASSGLQDETIATSARGHPQAAPGCGTDHYVAFALDLGDDLFENLYVGRRHPILRVAAWIMADRGPGLVSLDGIIRDLVRGNGR